MALVFAAVIPHSPLLVPNIGKENLSQFTETINAAKSIAEKLKEAKPDAIIVLTTKGPTHANGFTINSAPEFRANLEVFGDLVTRWDFCGATELAGRLREKLEHKEFVTMATEEGLDYATAIPLYLLDALKIPILPLTVGGQDITTTITFGKLLQSALLNEPIRIAVIASADLSHRVNKKSPLGYSLKGKKFDQKIIDALKEKNEALLIESEVLANDAACEDLPALGVMVGVLDDVSAEAMVLSYEAPFGVGHLVLDFRLG